MEDTTEDVCAGGLVWAARGDCPSNNDGEVEYDTKYKDILRNNRVVLPKVVGKDTTEQQQCGM